MFPQNHNPRPMTIVTRRLGARIMQALPRRALRSPWKHDLRTNRSSISNCLVLEYVWLTARPIAGDADQPAVYCHAAQSDVYNFKRTMRVRSMLSALTPGHWVADEAQQLNRLYVTYIHYQSCRHFAGIIESNKFQAILFAMCLRLEPLNKLL